tara:strand:- start:32519 stop:33046 length:528 start_codon:yes stop_codon:yes gene_type:complete
MDIISTEIKDVLLLKPSFFNDSRGYFFESYNQNLLSKHSFNIDFVQDNESKSKFGVLRGIHFQNSPFEQSKLIRVIHGKIQDVAIDLRPLSPTYKKYVSIILDDKNKEQLFIPKGFGHAFLTLSDTAIISYKVDGFYNKDADAGIKYDDPSININWELNDNQIILSDKDNKLPYL